MYLQELLGAPQPRYYHVPMLLAPDGRRLSKRDGDLDLEALSRHLSPQEILGLLAHWAGLLPKPEPVQARDLVPLFHWDRVPPAGYHRLPPPIYPNMQEASLCCKTLRLTFTTTPCPSSLLPLEIWPWPMPGGQVLARLEEGLLQLPRVEQCTGASGWIYGFSIDETHYYLPQGPALQAPGFSMVSNYRALAPGQTVFACAVGESLAQWYAGNRFCGACGRSLEPSTLERALVCPTCGRTVYPKICPAVIVAVCHGDRLLLTKYAGRSFRRYALVAGFNEIGGIH